MQCVHPPNFSPQSQYLHFLHSLQLLQKSQSSQFSQLTQWLQFQQFLQSVQSLQLMFRSSSIVPTFQPVSFSYFLIAFCFFSSRLGTYSSYCSGASSASSNSLQFIPTAIALRILRETDFFSYSDSEQATALPSSVAMLINASAINTTSCELVIFPSPLSVVSRLFLLRTLSSP